MVTSDATGKYVSHDDYGCFLAAMPTKSCGPVACRRPFKKDLAMQWYIDSLLDYRGIAGRVSRRDFLSFIAVTSVILGILVSLNVLVPHWATKFVFALFYIAVMWPSWARWVRRLHDIGRSGWMMLASSIPLFGTFFLLYIMLRGDSGPNKFGVDPRGANQQRGENQPVFYLLPAILLLGLGIATVFELKSQYGTQTENSPVGKVYIQSFKRGLASYHFDAPHRAHIDYTAALSSWTFSDRTPLPKIKEFTDVHFDAATRTFTGKVELHRKTLRGATTWTYVMVFSRDYSRIESGSVVASDATGKEVSHDDYGKSLNYIRDDSKLKKSLTFLRVIFFH